MRIQSLDLLRFIAAISVVFYHFYGTPDSPFGLFTDISKYGFLGVPLFFIISGFVITISADNRSPKAFLIARLIRILPMYWLGLILTSFIVIINGNFDDRVTIINFFANITLFNQYMNIPNIDGVYWTLQIEIIFYFMMFFLLLFGIFSNIKLWVSIWLLCLISFFIFKQPFFLPYFVPAAYAGFFIVGINLYLISKERLTRFTSFVGLVAAFITSYSAFNITPSFIRNASHEHQYIAGILVLIMQLIFVLIALDKLRLPQSKLLMILGGITYPLYLIHNLIGKILIEKLSLYLGISISTGLVVFGLIVVSYFMYLLIDVKLAKILKSKLLP
jgi:peptidoglycan/LPS O-acetylase OafA/YrhL